MHTHDKHVMELVAEYADGSQEWHCPTCGRRFIMKWPPDYNRAILDEGNPNAVHSGEVNGLDIAQYVDSAPDLSTKDSDPYLAPFKAWIEKYKE
jgi:hypothetical protein